MMKVIKKRAPLGYLPEYIGGICIQCLIHNYHYLAVQQEETLKKLAEKSCKEKACKIQVCLQGAESSKS